MSVATSPPNAAEDRRQQELWARVDRLVEAHLDDVPGLVAHGLGPLAARAIETRGATLPPALAKQARFTRLVAVTAPAVLERIRDACEGPIVLVKGPELACRYPGRARTFVDLDLIVPDARAVQRALLAAGFVEEPDPEGLFVGIHHLTPLRWPGTLLTIEVHSEPKWPSGLATPSVQEVLDRTEESSLGVPGILALEPAAHAVLLAAHAWAHQPLASVRDLLDVGALRADAGDDAVQSLARRFGVSKLVSTTTRALEAVLGGRRTAPLRLWAGHLADVRPQRVLEQHLERLLSPFWALPVATAVGRSAHALTMEFRPAFDETWGEKLWRTGQALRRPFTSVGTHDTLLGPSAVRGRRRNRPPEGGEGAS